MTDRRPLADDRKFTPLQGLLWALAISGLLWGLLALATYGALVALGVLA